MADDVADLGGLKWFLWGLQHRDREVLECWLRSDEPITPEFRAFLADLVTGKDKPAKLPRRRGGQPKSKAQRWNDNIPLFAAERYVDRIKRVWRLRYGRRYRTHGEAVEKAIAYLQRHGYPLEKQTLINYLARSPKDRRRI
jgi:hypothetical protein